MNKKLIMLTVSALFIANSQAGIWKDFTNWFSSLFGKGKQTVTAEKVITEKEEVTDLSAKDTVDTPESVEQAPVEAEKEESTPVEELSKSIESDAIGTAGPSEAGAKDEALTDLEKEEPTPSEEQETAAVANEVKPNDTTLTLKAPDDETVTTETAVESSEKIDTALVE